MGVPRSTIRVSNIPRTAIADELLLFFESFVGPVFACEIASAHRNWMSLGFGRVQFESQAAAENACFLSSNGRLPCFQRSNISVHPSQEDIIPRAVDESNRTGGAILHAGVLGDEGRMEVFASWEEVVLEFMPERKKMEMFVKDGGESYKLVVMFEDITASQGCSVGGGQLNSILFQLKFAPRIFQRLSNTILKPKFISDRYHICKENFHFVWLRTSDFTPTKAFGLSSYFCIELRNGPSVSEISNSFPYYSVMGDLILRKKEALCSMPDLVPIIGCSDKVVLPYDILFQLNSLVHTQKISLLHSIDLFGILRKEDSDTILKIFMKMHKLRSTCANPVQFIENELLKMRIQKAPVKTSILSENLMKCYRALITPSKVYLLGPELENSNYVIKHFSAYASDFLRVSFVDEDWGKLSSDALSTGIELGLNSKAYRTGIYNRILSILKDGITIGSKKFEFLAFSASQLRANSCWMFSSNGDITSESIRNWMGDFNKIRSVSKCAARMGQQFSSSFPVMLVQSKEVDIIDDIYSHADGIKYCFSDGIGKISLQFAEQIAQKCRLNKTPSAFQIRYGGYKGVIAVDRTSSKKLSLRPSMLKFDSNNTMLNITSFSKYLPCYLNREIISLLSTLGVDDAVFEAMQRDQIFLLDNMLTNRDAALSVIRKISGPEKEKAENILMRGYEPSSLPYLSMLLRACRAYQLADLRSRCRILVPKGRILIGCLDETGILDYGQTFLRVTLTKEEKLDKNQIFFKNADNDTVVIIGRVVVTKNPCLHPGDIRVLQAIYDPRLDEMGLVDCVIFPQKGERPHPNECSGGDLDGDLYFISWDERLVPPQTDQPMDHILLRPRLQNHEVSLEGHCGSCWAFGAVEALSDRFCIQFGMNISLSVNDLLACCGFKCGDGCDGGYPIYAWRYFVENGVVTEECDPYFDQVGCAHPGCEPVYPTPRCEKKCKVENLLWENSKRYSINAYKISPDSHDIMAEVYRNGPVEVAFTVYEDFAHYKSGVYRHITGDELGGHAVKLIGWGTSEQGEDFWLLANQWNRGWGDDGYFKILRGKNECGIEEDVVAGLPSTKNLIKTFAWMDDTLDASA